MKAKFIVNPTLKARENGGLDTVKTDMLMLTKISGMGLGSGPQSVDQRLDGQLSKKMKQKKFQGELGEHLSLQLGAEHPQRNVLLIGIGSVSKFNMCSLREVIRTAVDRAVGQACSRLTIPIVANRLTALNINLKSTANAIKQYADERLAELGDKKQQTLEIELLCTAQAKRHVQAGLTHPPRAKKADCACAPKADPKKE